MPKIPLPRRLRKPTMTLDEAKAVLAASDRESTERFTPAEREALIVIGVAWKMGEITEVEAAHLMGVEPGAKFEN